MGTVTCRGTSPRCSSSGVLGYLTRGVTAPARQPDEQQAAHVLFQLFGIRPMTDGSRLTSHQRAPNHGTTHRSSNADDVDGSRASSSLRRSCAPRRARADRLAGRHQPLRRRSTEGTTARNTRSSMSRSCARASRERGRLRLGDGRGRVQSRPGAPIQADRALVFPQTVISKRVEDGVEVDLVDMLRALLVRTYELRPVLH